MPSLATTLLILTVLLVVLPQGAYAFGAGDIPDWGYLESKAFRHGDIEAVLIECVKSIGPSGGGGLLGFAQKILSQGGKKFTKSDIQKVYFGNWLRDYSQCMDIAGLSKLSAETLVLVVQILGFMAFGYSTEEFEVTADRLGVYLCTEHIDNPRGYSSVAREHHPKLRGPVDPQELEIDESNGMKNYMATENRGWDTSSGLLKNTFRACIEKGRQAKGQDGAELWEAYRLLGTGMHTMEDLLAHSNWCELALRKMGHNDVFCHVGDNVSVNTPNGQAPPLITGTFGGADFMHSLLGEAGDKLSQASVTDLSAKMEAAKQEGGDSKFDLLKQILSQLPSGGDDKVNQGEELKSNSKAYHLDPDNIATPEVQKQLLDVLKWHDDVLRDIAAKIEGIPGLSDLMENLTNALNAYIYTLLEPWLTPILKQVTSALGEGSALVISGDDQFEVFNNADASDPSHSMLSKDHFGLILNEPAGQIAQIVVRDTVDKIVKAWFDDDMDVDQTINEILEAFHHPYYATGNSTIQQAMFSKMESWVESLGQETDEIMSLLTKESVKDHRNKRPGAEEQEEAGYGGHSHGAPRQQQQTSSHQESQYGDNSYSNRNEDETPSYGRQEESHNSYSGGEERSSGYGGGQESYGEQERSSGYGHSEENNSYGGNYESSRNENSGYSGYNSRNDDETPSYGRQEESQSYYGGGEERSSYGRSDEQESNSYGDSYGRNNEHESHYGRSSHSNDDESESFGRLNIHDDNSESHRYGRREENEGGYQY